jgi:hypothetical protein
MNISKVVSLICLCALSFAANAKNITIADGNIKPESGYLWDPAWMNTGREDNEVEPGCATGQNWDLEAFLLNGTTLSMVSGFDLKNGEKDGSITIRTSDLFVDVGGTNGTAYDYVYDINWSNGDYKLYEITSAGTIGKITLTPEKTVNAESNPISYTPGISQMVLKSGTITYTEDVKSGQSLINITGDADAGLLLGANNWGSYSTSGPNGTFNDLHNVASLDVSYFSGKTATFHLTMECGNDDMRGQASIPSVPEPGMMSLFGIGIFSIVSALFTRKKR